MRTLFYFPAPYPYLINYYYLNGEHNKTLNALRDYRESYAPMRRQ